MNIFDGLGYMWDPFQYVEDLVEKWSPKNCKTEKDFERSLYDYLHRKLEGKNITKQHGRGRYRVDLAVDDKLFIELKKDIDTTSKLQRVLGQLEIYSKSLDNLMLVICGEVEKNIYKQLEEKIESFSDGFPVDFQCSLIMKRNK